MASAAAEEVPVPPQYKHQPLYDFRHFPSETRGYKVGVTKYGKVGTKRKLEEYAEQVEREREQMEQGEAVPASVQEPAKRAKHNVLGVGKSSGRGDWKQPGERAGSLRNPKLSTSWEKKMKAKAEEAAFKDAKRAALAARKEAAAEERRRREEAKARKEAKRAAAAVTTRVSAATAKRMMKNKKQRKLLKTGDA